MDTPTNPASSAAVMTPIATMHARYEAAWAEDMRLEEAENALDDRSAAAETLKHRYDEAREKLGHETDALKVAILYQVPKSWADAIILQFHIWSMADLLASTDDRPEPEDRALLIAIDTLFDFMACELADIDHEAIGKMFKDGTMLAWRRRRTRTADLED